MTEEYVFINGKRVAMRDGGTLGAVHYYFADQVGSANVVTDAAGTMPPQQDIEYRPYGEQRVYRDTLGQEYRFTGHEHDTETNNDYFGARYYSSSFGRFLTPDWAATPVPVPYTVMGNPQTLNLYAYVENNPITGTDPDGHFDASGASAQGDPTTCQAISCTDPKELKKKQERDQRLREWIERTVAEFAAMGHFTGSAQFLAQNKPDPPKQETKPGEPKKVVRTGKHVYKKPKTINGRKFEGTAYRYKVVDAKNNIVRGPMNVTENLTRTPQTQELPQPATWSTTNGQFTDYVGYWTQGSFPQNYFNVVDQNFIVTQNGVSTLLDTTVQQTVSSDANGNVTGVAPTIEQ